MVEWRACPQPCPQQLHPWRTCHGACSSAKLGATVTVTKVTAASPCGPFNRKTKTTSTAPARRHGQAPEQHTWDPTWQSPTLLRRAHQLPRRALRDVAACVAGWAVRRLRSRRGEQGRPRPDGPARWSPRGFAASSGQTPGHVPGTTEGVFTSKNHGDCRIPKTAFGKVPAGAAKGPVCSLRAGVRRACLQRGSSLDHICGNCF